MPKPKITLPIYALVYAIVVSPNHNFQSYVAKTRNKYCNLTACENVTMSYPFQIPTQPPKCSTIGSNSTVTATTALFYP
ncbi:hypothetical protein E1A91_D12G001300v1 [Gossypium mustelinum]|uniref:Uncharacterized protein n=1 Tax=Gossypium mustelinum TaxID=34275 RepID=A0A5D2S8U0_GOSMU|nr:hypothetical protein E1A91_D12G001300v1 [Gossypium mustelinum]